MLIETVVRESEIIVNSSTLKAMSLEMEVRDGRHREEFLLSCLIALFIGPSYGDLHAIAMGYAMGYCYYDRCICAMFDFDWPCMTPRFLSKLPGRLRGAYM